MDAHTLPVNKITKAQVTAGERYAVEKTTGDIELAE
jgi:hypothetical protein